MRRFIRDFCICTVHYGSQQPHMTTEQVKCSYHIAQYSSRAHLYTNKNDSIEREKFMMQARDGSLRSQEKEFRAQVEESTSDRT